MTVNTPVRRYLTVPAALLLTLICAAPARADARDPWAVDWLQPSAPRVGVAGVSGVFAPAIDGAPAAAVVRPLRLASQDAPSAGGQTAPSERPRAVTYSHAYEVRRKIHVYASMAMLPLFATEIVLGQKLYNDPASDVRSAHVFVAGSIGTLFGVNTVTGVWNLIEARKDPAGKRRRLTHGLLMLSADAGFLATGLLAPKKDGSGGDRGTHRTVALTSMGVATAGYLYMLFTR
jgi:hypothetical protein